MSAQDCSDRSTSGRERQLERFALACVGVARANAINGHLICAMRDVSGSVEPGQCRDTEARRRDGADQHSQPETAIDGRGCGRAEVKLEGSR